MHSEFITYTPSQLIFEISQNTVVDKEETIQDVKRERRISEAIFGQVSATNIVSFKIDENKKTTSNLDKSEIELQYKDEVEVAFSDKIDYTELIDENIQELKSSKDKKIKKIKKKKITPPPISKSSNNSSAHSDKDDSQDQIDFMSQAQANQQIFKYLKNIEKRIKRLEKSNKKEVATNIASLSQIIREQRPDQIIENKSITNIEPEQLLSQQYSDQKQVKAQTQVVDQVQNELPVVRTYQNIHQYNFGYKSPELKIESSNLKFDQGNRKLDSNALSQNNSSYLKLEPSNKNETVPGQPVNISIIKKNHKRGYSIDSYGNYQFLPDNYHVSSHSKSALTSSRKIGLESDSIVGYSSGRQIINVGVSESVSTPFDKYQNLNRGVISSFITSNYSFYNF